jgi:hypothetical protein
MSDRVPAPSESSATAPDAGIDPGQVVLRPARYVPLDPKNERRALVALARLLALTASEKPQGSAS